MPKLKAPIPLNGGINTQANPTLHAQRQLRNARNAWYKRDDQTLRRRPDISAIAPGISDSGFEVTGCVNFQNTDKTFNKFVWAVQANPSGLGTTGALIATDVEGPYTAQVLQPNNDTSSHYGRRKPVQYNNILYWPTMPNENGDTGAADAWDGTSSSVREAGIDVQWHGSGATNFTINVAGAGSLTFATGRKYTYTIYDPVNLIESMPANNGSTLRTVDTGVIAAKGPVVTLTYNGSLSPNLDNTNNNHTHVRFYATTDGGSTYFLHSTVALSNANSSVATASITDSTSDAVLEAGQTLVFNSPPPPARFYAKFENKLVGGGAKTSNPSHGAVTGELVQSNVLYYSNTDEPEHWPRNTIFTTGGNAIPFKDQDGDSLVGALQVNRVLLVGMNNSIWSINHLPIEGVDPLFDFSTLKDRLCNTHGFISTNCYTSLALTDDEDAAFYVSQRGFHLNNGAIDRLVSPSIRWDETIYNADQRDKIHVTNDTTNFIIVVGFPSVDSDEIDSAYVYHYHPSHVDENNVGKVTGPWDYDTACSCLTLRDNGTRELWALTNSTTEDNSIVRLSGSSGYDIGGNVVPFEWETGWLRVADDASARLRELNFTVEEADAATLMLGESELMQVVPSISFLQLNSTGPVLKVLWDDDVVTVKQITGSGTEIPQGAGTVNFTTTDRAIISATVDCEIYGEEKSLRSLS